MPKSPKSLYWADSYIDKVRSAKDALKIIHPGHRVFISSSCGEPQHLVRTLADSSNRFTDLEIVRVMCLEHTPITLIANRTHSQQFNIRSFYLGSAKNKKLSKNARFITPINLSQVPKLFKSKMLTINVALIQVSPPDDFGWMSLGVSVDITKAAAEAADVVIAQVNPCMPRVLGRSFINVNNVDYIVEHEEPLLVGQEVPDNEIANSIAKHMSRLITDGSTLQTSLGATTSATLLCLSEKNDLGIHTQYISDGIMRLVSMGVITNMKKGFNNGKLIASSAVGSSILYEFLDDNPAIEFHPSDYVNDPRIISRHNSMVSMNTAMEIDLTGQVAADALPQNNFSGVNGMLDFIRGAAMSPNGKSILMLTSTRENGTISRIVPRLENTAVVIPRGDAQFVVTEYGAVNLFGKSIQERALALISIAHPDFRDELFERAKELDYIDIGRMFKESIRGVYPLKLEEVVNIKGVPVTLRPAKPADERAIQEHYYNMDRNDVISRFFHEKTSFVHDQINTTFEIDYINDLTIVAAIGEIGFEKIVAVGEYLLNPVLNMAEVAYSVAKEWQGTGIARALQNKLAEAAQTNSIKGLIAYTSPTNKGMIQLFHKLAYKVSKVYEDDMLIMSCLFDEPVEK
ncbi:MAG: GNAT family N-acetyltransferase [Desulfamplus sp.]|nr:GNAT family N-acetyltransferase [Desulfamplus sp.]